LFPAQNRALLRQAAARGVNAPLSSSAGRLFDAVAACLGICPDRQSYEGEAAMRLEALAEGFDHPRGLGFGGEMPEIDPGPMFHFLRHELRAGQPAGFCSAIFQIGLARAFAYRAADLVDKQEAKAIAFSGGCFQNAFLTLHMIRFLTAFAPGTPVLIHRTTPANDGGLALGQAVIAAARHLRAAEAS
jgi:hydrogenase maturation protein HypF